MAWEKLDKAVNARTEDKVLALQWKTMSACGLCASSQDSYIQYGVKLKLGEVSCR